MDEWYYAADNTRYGPITGDLVQLHATRGVITPETPMGRTGMLEWQTYLQLCGGQVPTPPTPEVALVPKEEPAATAPKEEPAANNPLPVSVVVTPFTTVSGVGKSKPKPATFEYGELKLKEADKELYVQGVLAGTDSIGKEWVLAGFWIRFAATIIDLVLFTVAFMGAMFLMTMIMGMLAPSLAPVVVLIPFIFAVAQLGLIYWYWIWPLTNSRQSTHGKCMLGLRVIRADGSNLTLGTAIGRFLAYSVSSALLYLGFVSAGIDREKRTFHDIMCNTRVIYN